MGLGSLPRVVGTVSSLGMLEGIPRGARPPCDIVEARLDLIGSEPGRVLDLCEQVEQAGYPVLATLRSEGEGGRWTGEESARADLLSDALARLSAVDIELASPLTKGLARLADGLGRGCVVSHHDFHRCPSATKLTRIVAAGQALGPAVVTKIAAMIQTHRELMRLATLLRHAETAPVCIIGMGPLGMRTRTAFPLLGSCLAYGYLDQPAAPGQLPCSVLTDHFCTVIPGYAAEHGRDPDRLLARDEPTAAG